MSSTSGYMHYKRNQKPHLEGCSHIVIYENFTANDYTVKSGTDAFFFKLAATLGAYNGGVLIIF